MTEFERRLCDLIAVMAHLLDAEDTLRLTPSETVAAIVSRHRKHLDIHMGPLLAEARRRGWKPQ